MDTVAVVLVSVPPLLLSLMLATVGVRTGWFAIGPPSDDLWRLGIPSGLRLAALSLFLPVAATGLPLAATVGQLQARAVRQARASRFTEGLTARGVPPRRIMWRHATRLAAAPVVSVYGYLAANVLNGALTVELLTGWPGLGRLLVEALSARDLPLVAGCVAVGSLVVTLSVSIAGLMVDRLDPRGSGDADYLPFR